MTVSSILYIDKPSGITSFDVIRRVRGILNIKKIGHAGTLDPLASGLLILGVGEGTKQMSEWVGKDKEYEVSVLVGLSTETGDTDGEETGRREVTCSPELEREVREVIDRLPGVLELPVPKYSAVKIKGKPLYKYAREGKEVEVPVREMRVLSAEFVGLEQVGEQVELRCRMEVESGVYVRSVVEYIGRELGLPATVSALRRTRVGEVTVSEARGLEELEREGV